MPDRKITEITILCKPYAYSWSSIPIGPMPEETPHSRKCRCGAFWSVKSDCSDNALTLRMVISDIAREKFRSPSTKSISLEVIFEHERPKSHYNSSGYILSKCEDLRPEASPTIYSAFVNIVAGLTGVAFVSGRQITDIKASREYAKDHKISIHIEEIENETDSGQMELFDL